jgi:hypothetical protein
MSERCTDGADDLRDREEDAALEEASRRQRAKAKGGEMSECPIKDGCKFLDEWYCPFKTEFNCPDPCSYAPILKLLAEAREVGDIKSNQRAFPDDRWDISFWIRR